MLSEDDVDLEDLECRLYSQVYHKNYEELQSSPQTVENCRISDDQNVARYYKMGGPTNQNQRTASSNNFSQHPSNPSMDSINASPPLASASPFVDNQRTSSSLIPQVINMVNPFNNIVVLPEATPYFFKSDALTHYINEHFEKKFLKRQNARLKKAMRRKMQKERKRNENSNILLGRPNSQETVFRMEPPNEQNLENNKPITNDEFKAEEHINIPTAVIDDSDSDSSCCVVIQDEGCLIVLSSDESDSDTNDDKRLKSKRTYKNLKSGEIKLTENKNCETCNDEKLNEADDDVIFVEPKPVEIIDIDFDSVQSVVDLNDKYIADADASKQQDIIDKSTETSPHSTDTFIKLPHSSNAKTKRTMTSKERRELLNTPDSTTSNDFLLNPVEAMHHRFNFGLHDSDFSSSQIFTKPKNLVDAYETESSCSTSDISSTPIKTALFNEVEFEAPVKQLFDDTNLEGFGDYITPNRSGLCNVPSIMAPEFERVNTKVTKSKCDLQLGLDSSSESEPDTSKGSYLDAKKTKQVLPNLCPIEMNKGNRDTAKSKTNKTKRKKPSRFSDGDSTMKQAGGNKRKSNFAESNEDNEAQKKTKNNQSSALEQRKNIENQSDNVGDSLVIGTKKFNENESKRSKNRKCFNEGNRSVEIVEKDAVESSSVTDSLKEKTFDEIGNVLEEDANNTAITINSDTDEVEIVDHITENSGAKQTVIENALENMVTSHFIVVDEIADEKNNADINDSFSSVEAQLSDFEELAGDLTLANCESGSRHPVQSDVPKKRTSFADYWINDSEKFHNRSWGLENFSVEEAQKSMPDDPDLWKIVDRDRVFVRLSTPRGQRCRRCREIGHIAHRCRNKPFVPSCNLCGTKGHVEPRCPKAVCTTCGSLGNYSVYCSTCAYWKNIQCKICHIFGHFDWACPDLWRRYHLTTKPGPIVMPEKTRGKLFQEKWCSNCAKFGHYEHTCRYVSGMHPSTTSDIKEYIDVYNFPKSQPVISLSESIEETNQSAVAEESSVKESNKHLEEANKEIKVAKKQTAEANNEPETHELPSSHVIVIDKEGDNNESNNILYPPNHMVPPYFQQQLSYLKFETAGTSESARKDEIISNVSAMIADDSLKLDEETKQKLIHGELHSRRILLLAYKFAYLHSSRGGEFLNNIRAKSNVNIIVKRSSPKAAEVGVIILYGNKKEVETVNNKLNSFLHTGSTINIRIIPRDSNLLYRFLFKFLKQVRFAQGNSKFLFDSIMIRKQKSFTTETSNARMKQTISSMYLRLNLLLFGRCKLQEGQKHVALLESWLKSTKNKQYLVELTDRFDIYEAYMYIYKSQRSDDEYEILCREANYHVDVEKPISIDVIGKKKRSHFSTKIKEIVKNCKKYNLKDELQQVTNIQAAVIKSNYSRTAYKDFLKYVGHFTKYFCKFRNSNT